MTKKGTKEKRVEQPSAAKKNFFHKTAGFFVRTGKKLKNFFVNLKAELKRVVWPDRRRLIQSTATVLAICVLIGMILFVIDTVLSGSLNARGFYSPKVTTSTTIVPTSTPAVSETLDETDETGDLETTESEADG